MRYLLIKMAVVAIITAIFLAFLGGPFVFGADGFPVNMNWMQNLSIGLVGFSGLTALLVKSGADIPDTNSNGDNEDSEG